MRLAKSFMTAALLICAMTCIGMAFAGNEAAPKAPPVAPQPQPWPGGVWQGDGKFYQPGAFNFIPQAAQDAYNAAMKSYNEAITNPTPQPPAKPKPVATKLIGPINGDLFSNGFTTDAQFKDDQAEFEDIESEATGLGPTFNNKACSICHSNPVTGGPSQIVEIRAGRMEAGRFIPPPGGTLVRSQAVRGSLQQRVRQIDTVVAERLATSLFGLGYVEMISDDDLLANRDQQVAEMRGMLITAPVAKLPVGNSDQRVGRFGWKCQQGSLLDFAADAYINEMGITSPLQPRESPTVEGVDLQVLSKPKPGSAFEDPPTPGNPFGGNIGQFVRFMRSLPAPERDADLAKTGDSIAGEKLFQTLNCVACHKTTWTTLPTGSPVGGDLGTVPAALGGKEIHPYSDFLLHDIGTGDGIVQGQAPANMLRTAPLWGVRARGNLMHDGRSFSFNDAILRHGGQAAKVTEAYKALPPDQQRLLLVFLRSL